MNNELNILCELTYLHSSTRMVWGKCSVLTMANHSPLTLRAQPGLMYWTLDSQTKWPLSLKRTIVNVNTSSEQHSNQTCSYEFDCRSTINQRRGSDAAKHKWFERPRNTARQQYLLFLYGKGGSQSKTIITSKS